MGGIQCVLHTSKFSGSFRCAHLPTLSCVHHMCLTLPTKTSKWQGGHLIMQDLERHQETCRSCFECLHEPSSQIQAFHRILPLQVSIHPHLRSPDPLYCQID